MSAQRQNGFLLLLIILGLSSCSNEVERPVLQGSRLELDDFSSGEENASKGNKSTSRKPQREGIMGMKSSWIPLKPTDMLNTKKMLGASWPQFYGNAQHDLPLLKTGLGQKNDSFLRKVQVGDGSEPLSCPILLKTGLFVNQKDRIYHIELKGSTPEQVSRPYVDLSQDGSFDPSLISGGVASDDKGEMLYVVTGDRQLISIDRANSKVHWKKELPWVSRGTPTVAGNLVLCVTYKNHLLAFDRYDGRLVWQHQGLSDNACVMGGGSVAVFDQVAVASYSSGQVVGVGLETGNVLWAHEPPSTAVPNEERIPQATSSPVIVDGVVYAVTQNEILAISLESGKTFWRVPVGGGQTPAITDSCVLTVDDKGGLAAFDRQTGQLLWGYDLSKAGRDINKHLSKKDGAPAKGGTDAVQEECVDRWIGPFWVNGLLYVWRTDGLGLILDPCASNPMKSFVMLKDKIESAPVWKDGSFIFASQNGRLIVWRPRFSPSPSPSR